MHTTNQSKSNAQEGPTANSVSQQTPSNAQVNNRQSIQFFPESKDVKDSISINSLFTESKSLSVENQLNDFALGINNYTCSNNDNDKKNWIAKLQGLLVTMQQAGYMSGVDDQGNSKSEVTLNHWKFGMAWTLCLWQPDLTSSPDEITEKQFIKIISKWLKSDVYSSFNLSYTRYMQEHHLKKLFRLYADGRLESDSKLDIASTRKMSIVNFVQCILLFLMPNGLDGQKHFILKKHAPLLLYNAIDCIYNALTSRQTGQWLQLFVGVLSRPRAEMDWRNYKLTEQPNEEVPFFLCIPEISLDQKTAFGLNLTENFLYGDKFVDFILAVDKTLVDTKGLAHESLGEWLVDCLADYIHHLAHENKASVAFNKS